MERRASLRKQIHQGASVRLPSGVTWPCVISDYCSKGMFLRFSAETSRKIESMGQALKSQNLTIIFDADKPGRLFKVVARPARIIPGAMGMQFIDRFDDSVRALDEASEETHSNKNLQGSLKREASVILAECLDYLRTNIGPRFQKVYPSIVEALKTSAKEAESDTEANAAMDAAALFHKETNRIHRLFLEGLHNPYIGHAESDSAQSNSDSLSLVSKGEFEDWLITRVLTTKTETLYRGLLLQLKMRLEAVGVEEKDNHNALGPALLINAFHSALTAVDIQMQAEKTIYRALELNVLQKLEDIYVELNNIFIRHNILPKLDYSKHLKKAPARQPPARPIPTPDEGGAQVDDQGPQHIGYDTFVTSGGAASADDQNIANLAPPFAGGTRSDSSNPLTGFQQSQEQAKAAYNNVASLIRALRSANSPAVSQPVSTDGVPLWTDMDLLSGLQDMQVAPEELADDLQDRAPLLDRVLGSMPQTSGERALPEEKQEAIDVVDRFFVSLKDNPRLSLDAKNHLLKLEIPVLKVLLQNANFFEDIGSPVHGVMNRIAQLGTKGARLNPASKKKVNSVVQRIAEEFEEDTAVFDDAVDELDRIIDRHNNLYKKNVERVAAAADGVHRVHQAKLAVGRALNKRLSQGQIPKAVDVLIKEGWRDLLQLTHIKHGPESEEWHRYLKIIDELIHFGNEPEKGIDVTATLSHIHDGLSELSQSDDIAPKVRDELQRMLRAKTKAEVPMVYASMDDDVISEDEQERRNTEKSLFLKQWIRRAKAIEIGSWLQFNKANEETQYMRLVWVAKGYTKFVFVNHQGMKVIELGLLKFASYLKDGGIIPDPDYDLPIVNQGLDSMVKDVYDKLAFQASHDKDSGLINKKEFCKSVLAAMKKGKESDSCSILFIRFSPFIEHQDITLTTEFVDKVTVGIEECANDSAIIGRINDKDFAVFSKNDELDMLDVRISEVLEQLCREEKDKSKQHVVAIGEARASLGSNDPENLLVKAAEALPDSRSTRHAEAASVTHTEQDQDEAEITSEQPFAPESEEPLTTAVKEPSATDMEEPSALDMQEPSAADEKELSAQEVKQAPEAIEEDSATFVAEESTSSKAQFGAVAGVPTLYVEEAEEATEEQMSFFKSGPEKSEELPETDPIEEAIPVEEDIDIFAGLEKDTLEIRAQKALSLASDSVHEEQHEIGLFMPGRAAPLSSEDEAVARGFDMWWIDQLATSELKNAVSGNVKFIRVRISGYALTDDRWMERLLELCDQGNIQANTIWFDLYKCSVIENVHAAADMIRNLMTKGFRFCLDQFGSPNTPYALMKYLPVDMIKIDESFVESLNDPNSTEERAESIVEVAHYFGKEVLASAVDSAICMQKMKVLKVDYVQGRSVSPFELLTPPVFQ